MISAVKYFLLVSFFFVPLVASIHFNIERPSSTGIGSNEKFALYTQISSHSFSHTIVAYESDTTTLVNKNETEVNNIVLKIDMINKKDSTIINTYYVYFDATGTSRLTLSDISIPQAFQEVFYKISTKVDTNSTEPFHVMCTNTNALKSCYDNLDAREISYISQDTFSIRPAIFYYALEPSPDLIYNNTNNINTINIRTGEDYSLSVYAQDYKKNIVSNYNGTSVTALIFQGDNQCPDKNNTLFSGQSFVNGILNTFITQEETATYILNITDNTWTQSDRIKGDCIENSNVISPNDSTGKSGCDISSYYPNFNYNDKNITFMVNHFELNITKQTNPEKLGNTLYMNTLQAPQNLMSSELNGTIIAKSATNMTLKNFTNECMATPLSLGFNIESYPALNLLAGGDNTRRFFLQYSYNSETPINIKSNLGSDIQIDTSMFKENGQANLRLNFNIDRNNSLAINPVRIQFTKLFVEGNNSKSIFGIPQGKLNDLGENTFLYARARASKKYYYAKGKNQITPIAIDVYCQNLSLDSNITCQNYGTPTSFSTEGWWLATAYRLLNAETHIQLLQGDTKEGVGNLSFENHNPVSIPIDGIGVSDSNSSINASNITVSTTCPNHRAFEAEVVLHTNSATWIGYRNNTLYTIHCFGSSQWSGVGNEASTLKSTSSFHDNRRTSW